MTYGWARMRGGLALMVKECVFYQSQVDPLSSWLIPSLYEQ